MAPLPPLHERVSSLLLKCHLLRELPSSVKRILLAIATPFRGLMPLFRCSRFPSFFPPLQLSFLLFPSLLIILGRATVLPLTELSYVEVSAIFFSNRETAFSLQTFLPLLSLISSHTPQQPVDSLSPQRIKLLWFSGFVFLDP